MNHAINTFFTCHMKHILLTSDIPHYSLICILQAYCIWITIDGNHIYTHFFSLFDNRYLQDTCGQYQ